MSLAEEAVRLGAPLSEAQIDQLLRYRDALLASPHNVTALAAEGIERDLIIDALAGAACLRDFPGSVIDVGTGGGVPGIPLAVADPTREFVLLDASAKKIGFVQSVIDSLGLSHAAPYCMRVEDAGRDAALRERFGVALAKAVAPIRVLVEWLVPLVAPEGRVLLWKGPAVDEEIAEAAGALAALGASVERVCEYHLPDRERRALVVIKRQTPLDARYPRRVGVATKKPL